MQTHCAVDTLSAVRTLAAQARCPNCGDWMVAPVMSEFVEGGEIRHHWECDACGEYSCTTLSLVAD